jgi:cellulose synthase/poly-beta-1,6-N-acetylglucosamine synthase-like glycosyltransferase
MPSLDPARRSASPRLSPPPTPVASVAIHGTVAGLWLVAFVSSFWLQGVFAWSVGVIYIAYDTLLLAFVAIGTWQLTRPQRVPTSPPVDAPGTIGVIIAAHNEAAVLPITVAALLDQSDPPDEILIADDGSSDGTADLLHARYGIAIPALGDVSEAGSSHPTLRWLRLPHGGKARALNAALAAVTAETILTVDADTLLDQGAIAAMREAFRAEPDLVAATGVLTPVCGASLSGRFFAWFQTYEYIRNFLSRFAWMQLNSLLLISGAFAAFRKQAVIAVGGFDPECLVEDYEMIHRLRRYAVQHNLPCRTRVLGSARARTTAPSTVPAFLRQRSRWFGGFLQTQYWYRDMVGDRRYGWLGVAMLPVKAIDTFQPIYGLTALALLFFYIATGKFAVVGLVAGLMGGKIVIDLAFQLWSVHLYGRWVGEHRLHHLGYALLAAIAEPFSFQILRHTGASLGWLVFLTGRRSWGKQSRLGLAPDVG